MAAGDAAAAIGMTPVSGGAPANTIDTLINEALDYIAQFTADIRAATGNGSGAGANKLARFGPSGNIAGADPTAGAHFTTKDYVDGVGAAGATGNTIMRRNASGQTAVADPTAGGHAATKNYVDNNDTSIQSIAQDALNGELNPAVYTRTLGGSYRNLYVDDDGTLGWVSSSRRFKKNIADWTPDRQAILAMRLVEFQYKVAVDTRRTGAIEHGLIAEELDELGLDWLVDYGADGTPEGVRYDRLSLALLSIIQDHEARLTALENKE